MKKGLFFSLSIILIFAFVSFIMYGTSTDSDERCISCHKEKTPGLFSQWSGSKHAENGVTCTDCHGADKNDPDAFNDNGVFSL